MTKATRIINKYHIKEMLLNGNPQFENFYKEELIQFCEVAKELSKQYQREHQELNEELAIYKNVILANNDIPNLEDFLNKPINPDLSNWSICDIQYIKGYLYALSLREQELKKQLEERTKMYLNAYKYVQGMENEVITLNTQQKEFIKYLEDEIYSCEAVSDLLFNSNKEMKVYKEILQKYEEIIGVSDENKRN